ncbi:MAG: hypothetical protein GY753_07695 [Gammaproteobacteria bacterium]|nr:hypothetical protein [Gammaproteobacteria bacterium]
MAITRSTAAKNAAANAVVDLLDAGSGAGTLVLYLANGTTEVATLTFSDPAYGAAASGTAQENSITDDSSATGNASPATVFKAMDSDSNVVFEGTVGTAGADLNLTNNTIAAGEAVSVTDFSYTAT